MQHDAEHARELLLSSPSKDANSSRLGGSDGSDPLEPAWDSFKAHPLALEDEEKATADYFRRLKMIQLEQETRNIFIHDTNDDTQTIYSSADVRRLEEEAREVKAQLQVRKRQMREERAAIERISAGAAVFDDLRNDVAEAQQLVAQIQDMEIELARLHVVQGASIGGADATKTPILGSFTRDEAEEILNNQVRTCASVAADPEDVLMDCNNICSSLPWKSSRQVKAARCGRSKKPKRNSRKACRLSIA